MLKAFTFVVINIINMDIQLEKIELIKLLLNTDNPKIIQSIRDIFNSSKSVDFWDELSYNQQLEIKQGSKDIIEGKTNEYESFMANHR